VLAAACFAAALDRAKLGGTDCISSVTQKVGSPGGMRARRGKITAVQLGGSEINQDQYTLATRDRARRHCCIKRRASSPRSKVEKQAPSGALETAKPDIEGFPHGFWTGRWSRSAGPIA
jgi:hypothetical protein